MWLCAASTLSAHLTLLHLPSNMMLVCMVTLQGSTVVYAMLSSMAEINDKVSVTVHLGPVVFLEFMRAPFLKAMGEARNDIVSKP